MEHFQADFMYNLHILTKGVINMIIWSGRGLLVVVALMLSMAINFLLQDALAGSASFPATKQMDGMIFSLAAVLNFALAKFFASDGSSLFFIPNK